MKEVRSSFLGDPYAAQLDITASYSLNANLSELDESFLEDRELNRTNVRVDALMFVKGDIRQPDNQSYPEGRSLPK